MQRKRHCAPIDEIGITVERMTPSAGNSLLGAIYILAILAVAVLFLLLLP